MARVLITGSSDGIGLLAAQSLIASGHKVVLHARNDQRAQEAWTQAPGAQSVLTADFTNIEQTKELAARANASGIFDAVIHNAGVYEATPDQIFTVNVLAPYILTSLMEKPSRLVYVSSGMHRQGHLHIENGKADMCRVTYSDSKLYVYMLACAVARKWPDVFSNAVDPGWVPTKMGGSNAPDSLQKGYETQVWLAVSDDEKAKVTGRYFFHQKESAFNPEADDVTLQDILLKYCENISGIGFDVSKR